MMSRVAQQLQSELIVLGAPEVQVQTILKIFSTVPITRFETWRPETAKEYIDFVTTQPGDVKKLLDGSGTVEFVRPYHIR